MPEPPGPETLVSPDPSGRSRRGAAGETTGAGPELGNLLSDVPVLEVLDPGNTWPDADRPVHLRGFVIEAFDEDGVLRERAGPRTVERADGDGWIRRAAAPSGDAISRREVELEVRSRGPALELVFAPHASRRPRSPPSPGTRPPRPSTSTLSRSAVPSAFAHPFRTS